LFAAQDARLHNAYRAPAQAGWIFVHLEGSPTDIGYQHGYLLSAEIEDSKKAIELSTVHAWPERKSVNADDLRHG